MKKISLLILVSICFLINAGAQVRKLRDDEIKFYNNLHQVLYAATPHEYKDWKVVEDGNNFDVIKFFCQIVYADNDCTGKCPVSIGKGDPYSLTYSADYAMPGDQADALKGAAMAGLTDYNNAQQVAGVLKASAKTKLQIRITANVSLTGPEAFTLVNCPKIPIQTLSIPVPTTLAVLGTRSEQCPYMRDGRVDMSPSGDGYMDDAVVFMGKPVAAKVNQGNSDGYTHTGYGIGFDRAKIGVPIVQNIVVTFKGDAEDIKAAVQQIDWQKLNALLAK